MMSTMIGDPPRSSNPTVQIPDYLYLEDPTVHIHSPNTHSVLAALQRYLPSNKNDAVVNPEDEEDLELLPADAFSCDDFRMFEFKVKKCSRARSHDWTECPFAHPGEKARRRDPRKFHYSGCACPDFRKGACRRGDACEYAHGVFECWLHPARYRTQPCKDGSHCRRRVCFFAHSPEQLRVLPPYAESPEGSPSRIWCDSPSRPGYDSVAQLGLQLDRMKVGLGLGLSVSPPSWRPGFGSPRSTLTVRHGFMSMPSTPVRAPSRVGFAPFDAWEASCEEERVMERVESGREMREKMYAKLGKENSLDRVGRGDSSGHVPDFEWVSELVQ